MHDGVRPPLWVVLYTFDGLPLFRVTRCKNDAVWALKRLTAGGRSDGGFDEWLLDDFVKRYGNGR